MKKIIYPLFLTVFVCSCAMEKYGPYGKYEFTKVDFEKLESMKQNTFCKEKYFDPNNNVESDIEEIVPIATIEGRISDTKFIRYNYKNYSGVYKEYCVTIYGL